MQIRLPLLSLLNSAYNYSIPPMDKAIVKTDIQIAVPHGYYGRVGECLSAIQFLFVFGFILFYLSYLLCELVLVFPVCAPVVKHQVVCNCLFVVFPSPAPRSGLAAKHFIDVGGELASYLT